MADNLKQAFKQESSPSAHDQLSSMHVALRPQFMAIPTPFHVEIIQITLTLACVCKRPPLNELAVIQTRTLSTSPNFSKAS